MEDIVCKYCGSSKGFYIKTQIYCATETYFNSDGSYALEGENSALHDGLSYKYGKNIYCSNCQKPIGKVADLREGIEIIDY